MHMGIFCKVTAVILLDSHSTRWKPVWWPRSAAPSCNGAGQTHRLLLHRAVVSSDKLSYWPAETCSYLQKNHTHVLLCFFLPCEKQTPKQTVTYFSCADRILNTIQQRCDDASGWTMTHDNIFSILPSLSVAHSLTHDHTIGHANKHTHRLHHVNKSISGQTKDIHIHSQWIWMSYFNTNFLFSLHASR